MTKGY